MTPAEYPDADLIVLYLIYILAEVGEPIKPLSDVTMQFSTIQLVAVAWLLVEAPRPIKPPQLVPPDVTMQFSTIQLVAVAWLLVAPSQTAAVGLLMLQCNFQQYNWLQSLGWLGTVALNRRPVQ